MRALFSPIFKKLSFLRSRIVKQTMLYFLFSSMLFLLLSFTNRFFVDLSSEVHLLCFMLITIALGSLNYWILNRVFEDQLSDWMKAVLTVIANVLGVVFYLSLNVADYNTLLFIPALFLFCLPWFFIASVKAIRSVPKLEYLPIQISNLKDIVAEINWAEDETKGIVWEFEALAEMNEEAKYWVRTHTPHQVEDFKLKDLFKGLLSLHNHNLSPARPIYFEQQDGYYGWRFFREKRVLFWKRLKPLNPEKTLRQNGIYFQRLSKKERLEINDLRKGLADKFRRTKIRIVRVNA